MSFRIVIVSLLYILLLARFLPIMAQIFNDPEFFYDDGDCFIQVENNMFCVRCLDDDAWFGY